MSAMIRLLPADDADAAHVEQDMAYDKEQLQVGQLVAKEAHLPRLHLLLLLCLWCLCIGCALIKVHLATTCTPDDYCCPKTH